MRLLAFLLLLSLQAFAQDTTQHIIAGRSNAKIQQEKPYVILISADGFRSDFSHKYEAKFLQSKEAIGVKASYMQASYPSLTFPNHYTIATGLYPAHHGLVDNTYLDVNSGQEYRMSNKKMVGEGKWYGGTPLWVLAEKQQMIAASFYWVASDANIQDTYPTYYYVYNEAIDIKTRIAQVKHWLSLPADKRPHLITFYFPEVDHDAHEFGPEDPRVLNSVQFVDKAIADLEAALAPLGLPINFVFVSDHGMKEVDNVNTIGKPAPLNSPAFQVPFGDALLHVYAKDPSKIDSTYQELKKDSRFTTYKMDQTPAHWHYRKSDDRFNRLGDLLLVPKLPQVFNLSSRKTSKGKHGFDTALPEMRASFQAWGPAIKPGLKLKGFENVNVYPFIAKILGLTYDPTTIDGNINVLKKALR